jgi:hypothetical protein
MKKRRSVMFVLAAALLGGSLTLHPPAAASADVVISVQVAPPVLPVYSQPPCPGPGFIWTPGYWGWSPDAAAYYWVPGTWVQPPQIGYLWTPGYWGWSDSVYVWHPGFWAQQVGFYGGINYGFGYPGSGFYGGYWRDRQFYYNRAVNNVNVTVVRNVYVRKVVIVRKVTRVSYNGGHGGVIARPRHGERVRGPHFRAVAAQRQQRDLARRDRGQFFGHDHARPAVYATPRPGAFQDRHAVRAPRASRAVQPQRSGGARPTPAPGRPQVHQERRQPQPHQQRPPMRHTTPQRPAPHRQEPDRPALQPRAMARPAPRRPAPPPRQITRPAPRPSHVQHSPQRQQQRPARHAPAPRPPHPQPAAHRPPAHEPHHPQR